MLVALALIAAAAASCGNDSADAPAAAPAPPPVPESETSTPEPEPPPEPAPAGADGGGELLVGYVLPATGSLAIIGEPILNGIEMALSDINESGHMAVRLLPGDSGTDPVIANRAVDDHLAEGVSAIVGAAASGISLSIIDKVAGAGVVQMSPSNTSPSLSVYDDGGWYFRTIPPDLLHAKALGDLVTDEGITAAGIIHRADDWGRNLADEVAARLDANGVDIATVIAYDPEGTSFDAEVQQLLASGADGTVLIAFEEGAAILRGMIEAGIGPAEVPLFIPNGLASNTLWEAVDPSDPSVLLGAKGTFFSATPAGGETTFPERYEAAHPDAELLYAAPAYDTLIVLALASLAAGSVNAADYVGEINDVTRGGTKCARFAACADLIAAGTDIDYDGASGPLDFTDIGEPSIGSYDTFYFDEQGQIVIVTQITSAIG
jgi:branched-chain amino acid transport system substrate-binding protein